MGAFRVAPDFIMLQKQCGFLTSSRNKIKNDQCILELLTLQINLTTIDFQSVYFSFTGGHDTEEKKILLYDGDSSQYNIAGKHYEMNMEWKERGKTLLAHEATTMQ